MCTANTAPTASITSPAANQTITSGTSVSFAGTASDPENPITAYQWRVGSCTGTLLSTSSSFSYNFPTPGTYRIYLRAYDGCTWSTNCPSRTITVSPVSYVCTGTIPANATMYANDNTGLTSNTPYTYSATNTATKCQYACNAGYTWNGSACTTPAICTGSVPTHGTAYDAEESTGLTVSTAWTHSTTDTATKCQFRCDSSYTYNSSNGQCECSDVTYSCLDIPPTCDSSDCGPKTGSTSCQRNSCGTFSTVSNSLCNGGSGCADPVVDCTDGCSSGSASPWKEVKPQ